MVTDQDGAALAAVKVTIVSAAGDGAPLTAASGPDGHFQVSDVPLGPFRLTLVSPGLVSETVTGVLNPGVGLQLNAVVLPLLSTTAQVDVVASRHEQADAELKVEEKQRVLGFFPNFYVAYNWRSAPLSTGQKYQLAYKELVDPVTLGIDAMIAGIQLGTNALPGYGPGAAGYGKRLGANLGDTLGGILIGGAILPSVLHQDPRYFYKGTGTVRARVLYALAASVICRGDNGKWQFNYSSVVGDFAAAAITDAYYPASNREGASLTLENGLLAVAEDGIGNLVQEFLFKHVTPHAPDYPAAVDSPAPADQTTPATAAH